MSSRLRPQRLANLATAAGGITLDSTFGTLRSALGLFSRVRVSAARVRAGRTGVLPKRSARFKVGGAVCPRRLGKPPRFGCVRALTARSGVRAPPPVRLGNTPVPCAEITKNPLHHPRVINHGGDPDRVWIDRTTPRVVVAPYRPLDIEASSKIPETRLFGRGW